MKKRVIAAILASAMLLTSCSMLTDTRKPRRDRDDDDDSGSGFTRRTEETTEATTTTTAETRPSSDPTTPTESTASSGVYTDADFAAAYTSYLSILEDNEDEIRAYDWMAYEGGVGSPDVMEPLEDCQCALADVTGDTLPELFIMKAETDYMATLEIYTYNPSNGQTSLILTEDGLDVLAGGGGRYMIASLTDGCLFIYEGLGDEEWTDDYNIYLYDHDEEYMELIGNLEFHQDLDDEGIDYVYDYYMNGVVITEDEFQLDKHQIYVYIEYVLQYNYITDEDAIELTEDKPKVAFSYDEMYEILTEAIVDLTT